MTDFFAFWDDFARYVDRNYVDLFDVASEELSEIYDRLYSRQIFDWELNADDEDLDDVVKKTFWHLNHYDFENVDRDVLGHLYERHLPPEERKELGNSIHQHPSLTSYSTASGTRLTSRLTNPNTI
ncbi:hypothetical protein D8S78_12515 [Natrialba swarupiae]|nr:hypothetical protein [Natrialba swarupiae]